MLDLRELFGQAAGLLVRSLAMRRDGSPLRADDRQLPLRLRQRLNQRSSRKNAKQVFRRSRKNRRSLESQNLADAAKASSRLRLRRSRRSEGLLRCRRMSHLGISTPRATEDRGGGVWHRPRWPAEMARIYRLVGRRKIPSDEARSRVWMLERIGQRLEAVALEDLHTKLGELAVVAANARNGQVANGESRELRLLTAH